MTNDGNESEKIELLDFELSSIYDRGQVAWILFSKLGNKNGNLKC
jgi:hypothetical protein